MSKFNAVKTAPAPDTVNFHGKPAYGREAKSELAGILLTSFLENQFYRSGSQTQERLVELVGMVDPLFAAKAAIFARNTFGMRSVTHVVAGELAQYASGALWLRRFYSTVVMRPDDVTEILSYYLTNRTEMRDSTKGKGKRPRALSKAMQRGLGDALCRFGPYQLGKYKASDKGVSMVDAINLLRPRKTDAKGALLAGTLAAPDTWEVNLTKAGQSENKAEAKAQVWSDLLINGKLGALAALRNVRNVVEQAPDAVPMLCELLTDEKVIRKSRIFPFQYLTAWDALESDAPRAVRIALSQAFDTALGNLPQFEGKTLVAVDASGSMRPGGWLTSRVPGTKSPLRTAAIFAAALYKRNDADVLWFSGGHNYGFGRMTPETAYCGWVTLNPLAPVLDLAKQIENESQNGNTDFRLIFSNLTKPYDRIIILTDEQAWVGDYTRGTPAMDGLKDYRRRLSCDPWAYSIDLTGYGTSQFLSTKITQLYGLSERLFDFMEHAERGTDAIVDAIERVEF